jgi:hypothetical protein
MARTVVMQEIVIFMLDFHVCADAAKIATEMKKE